MFTAQSQTNLTILMLAGAVFAGAGLWLLIRPKGDADTAKIELFGLKFESSSAGVLVFVVGAGFLSLPLFVDVERAQAGRAAPGAPLGGTALDAGPIAEEVEPNDGYREANALPLGTVVTGVADGEDDWFVISTEGLAPNEVIEFRFFVARGQPHYADIYDARQDKVSTLAGIGSGAEHERAKVRDNARFYARIYDGDPYEFSASVVPGE